MKKTQHEKDVVVVGPSKSFIILPAIDRVNLIRMKNEGGLQFSFKSDSITTRQGINTVWRFMTSFGRFVSFSWN